MLDLFCIFSRMSISITKSKHLNILSNLNSVLKTCTRNFCYVTFKDSGIDTCIISSAITLIYLFYNEIVSTKW
jgi:hypothetical protein